SPTAALRTVKNSTSTWGCRSTMRPPFYASGDCSPGRKERINGRRCAGAVRGDKASRLEVFRTREGASPFVSLRCPDVLSRSLGSTKRGRTSRTAMPKPNLPPRIKVFRPTTGFPDWGVATSSQQAALDAWDVSRNLFATGEAAITDDETAIKLALANLGKAVP